jgi:hypothetical protein
MTTSSKFNTAEVVRFISDTAQRLEAENIDLSPALDRAVAERFPEMTVGQYRHVLTVWKDDIDAERAEFEAEYERETAWRDTAKQIFAGLENVTFAEACRIKAQGEGPVAEAARHFLITMDNVTARLGEAAQVAHPDFVQTPDHVWHYTGPGEMPSVEALIDWFQMTYPDRARAIEDDRS